MNVVNSIILRVVSQYYEMLRKKATLTLSLLWVRYTTAAVMT